MKNRKSQPVTTQPPQGYLQQGPDMKSLLEAISTWAMDTREGNRTEALRVAALQASQQSAKAEICPIMDKTYYASTAACSVVPEGSSEECIREAPSNALRAA